MNFSFIHPFKLRRDPADAHTYRNPISDQTQGGEFLDDAIYREDVQEIPVSYTEERKQTIDEKDA
ncbi:hypothetical protein [Niastella sp. OAS944]|uniref:hypothetical protein n=1 Tax=Niastella sp. OAS944 TaxID=2664089 RepID=UPI003472E168|nr:hypothetical protein [Chitinophagaceae bacterium OAS944]